MVNHVRNLLANATSASDFPKWLAGVAALIFPSNADIDSRVNVLYAVVSVEELRKYITRFDPRLDNDSVPANSVVAMCRTRYMPSGIGELIDEVKTSLHVAAVLDKLFSWDEYAADMSELRKIYDNSCERSLCVAAFVLAFAYQVERRRRSV